MSHFAKVENGIVTRVIVAEPEFFETFTDTTPGEWIQTSYNTHAGKHALGGTPLRKNYAGVGFTYNSTRDAFIPPQIYNSWVLDEETCQWEAPIPYPTVPEGSTDIYSWNEETQSWDLELVVE